MGDLSQQHTGSPSVNNTIRLAMEWLKMEKGFGKKHIYNFQLPETIPIIDESSEQCHTKL